MSDATKARMSMAAVSKTLREYELRVRKLLDFADCPCVTVFASSGAPSTENSFTCEFNTKIPGWRPDCPTMGKKLRCKAFAELTKRDPRDYVTLVVLLRLQQAPFSEFEQVVEGSCGWFKVKGEELWLKSRI